MGIARRITSGAALLVASAAVLPAEAAPADLSRYQGAWLEQGSSCEEIFSRTGRGVSFRSPVSPFSPAFIVTGTRLRTPSATCRIKGIKQAGDRETLLLTCSTAVAVSDAAVLMSPAGDLLKRYTGSADPVGMAYRRCKL